MNADYIIGGVDGLGIPNELGSPLGLSYDYENDRLFVADMTLPINDDEDNNIRGSVRVYDVRPENSSASTLCGKETYGIINGLTSSCIIWNLNANEPRDVAYDGVNHQLFIAYPATENRVLVFDARTSGSLSRSLCGVNSTGLTGSNSTASEPSCVLGQPDLETYDSSNDILINNFYSPRGLWFDDVDNQLFVADLNANRVLIFNDMSDIQNGMDADAVLGQIDFVSGGYATNQSSLTSPNAVVFASATSTLYVSDANNNRIMIWDTDDLQGNISPSTTPTPIITPAPNLSENATGAIFVIDHSNQALSVMTNGIKTNEGDDSWNGGPKSEDYWGLSFGQEFTFSRVVYTTGTMFFDGGWFDSNLVVQVRQDGDWVTVTGQNVSPEYPYTSAILDNTSFTFTFNAITGDAIRIHGVPGGSNDFTSIGEFEVYDNYSHIIRLPDTLKGKIVGQDSTDIEMQGFSGFHNVLISSDDNIPLALIEADFSANRDWSSITFGKNIITGKSFVHGITSQTGADSNFTLYVPIPAGIMSKGVVICPGASSLNKVAVDCTDAQTKTLGDSDVTQVTNAYGNFWVVSGLTGTGGISLIDVYAVNDVMTRLQIDTLSDHLIDFGTVNGLLLDTDRLTLTFGYDWNLDNLRVDDLDLLDDGTNLTLADTATTDIWGVDIDSGYSGSNIITFSPPTDGTNYIATSSIIQIKIGKNAVFGSTGFNQILNPFDVDIYTLDTTITNAIGTESAQFTVPIVDSDEVNVSGYVNNFIVFDIDTTTSFYDDCDFNTCLIHSEGGIGGNYTVDFGELNANYVNRSQDVEVKHSDNNMGLINSIYLDLTSNAINGTVVNVYSANGSLNGPYGSKLLAVVDGNEIGIDSGLYGFTIADTDYVNGDAINVNPYCYGFPVYCGPTINSKLVFNTNGKPIDSARVQVDLAAAASYTNNPGDYTDTLTFIATGSF